jgi:hypothetical protein
MPIHHAARFAAAAGSLALGALGVSAPAASAAETSGVMKGHTASEANGFAEPGGTIKGDWSLYPGVAGAHVWGGPEKSGKIAMIKIKDTADDEKEACAYIHVTRHAGAQYPNQVLTYCAPGGTKGDVQTVPFPTDQLKTLRVQECVDNALSWEKCGPGSPGHPTRLVYRDP